MSHPRVFSLTTLSAALTTALLMVPAQAQTSASGQITTYQKPTGIIAPIDADALKGRVGKPSTGTKPKPTTPATPLMEATPKSVGNVSKLLPTAKPRPVPPAPLVGRGDEDSYRQRGLLPTQVSGSNRFGGSTYALPTESLMVDFDDALAGFASFDKLGTLREKKVFRANGTSVTTTYDPRSGDLQDTKTDTPSPTADIAAGGVVVMPGTSLSSLIKQGVPTTVPAPSASTQNTDGTVRMEGINRLIPPTAP